MYWNSYADNRQNGTTDRLTLTWDVLKYVRPISISYKSTRLTLTWDVLKSVCPLLNVPLRVD